MGHIANRIEAPIVMCPGRKLLLAVLRLEENAYPRRAWPAVFRGAGLARASRVRRVPGVARVPAASSHAAPASAWPGTAPVRGHGRVLPRPWPGPATAPAR